MSCHNSGRVVCLQFSWHLSYGSFLVVRHINGQEANRTTDSVQPPMSGYHLMSGMVSGMISEVVLNCINRCRIRVLSHHGVSSKEMLYRRTLFRAVGDTHRYSSPRTKVDQAMDTGKSMSRHSVALALALALALASKPMDLVVPTVSLQTRLARERLDAQRSTLVSATTQQ